MTGHMVLVSTRIPQPWLSMLDSLVGRGLYESKSDAIRAAIRNLLKEHSVFRKPAQG